MASYRDINIAFTKNSFTDDLNVVDDSTAIKQSIKNILLTFNGERSFEPKFGAQIQKNIFEPSTISSSTLNIDLIEILNTFEPRIKVKNVSTSYQTGNLKISINYDYFFDGKVINEDAVVSVS